jgi:hypothetical protein
MGQVLGIVYRTIATDIEGIELTGPEITLPE